MSELNLAAYAYWTDDDLCSRSNLPFTYASSVCMKEPLAESICNDSHASLVPASGAVIKVANAAGA